MTASADGYLADDDVGYRYPTAGDPMPPNNTKLLLLTKGGVVVTNVSSKTVLVFDDHVETALHYAPGLSSNALIDILATRTLEFAHSRSLTQKLHVLAQQLVAACVTQTLAPTPTKI